MKEDDIEGMTEEQAAEEIKDPMQRMRKFYGLQDFGGNYSKSS